MMWVEYWENSQPFRGQHKLHWSGSRFRAESPGHALWRSQPLPAQIPPLVLSAPNSPWQLWLEISLSSRHGSPARSTVKMTSGLGTWCPIDRKRQRAWSWRKHDEVFHALSRKVHRAQECTPRTQKQLLRTWDNVDKIAIHCLSVFGHFPVLQKTWSSEIPLDAPTPHTGAALTHCSICPVSCPETRSSGQGQAAAIPPSWRSCLCPGRTLTL